MRTRKQYQIADQLDTRTRPRVESNDAAKSEKSKPPSDAVIPVSRGYSVETGVASDTASSDDKETLVPIRTKDADRRKVRQATPHHIEYHAPCEPDDHYRSAHFY